MFDKLMMKVQRLAASVVAWQVNSRYEKIALHLLEQAHVGATPDWVSTIVEIRGRHALRAFRPESALVLVG